MVWPRSASTRKERTGRLSGAAVGVAVGGRGVAVAGGEVGMGVWVAVGVGSTGRLGTGVRPRIGALALAAGGRKFGSAECEVVAWCAGAAAGPSVGVGVGVCAPPALAVSPAGGASDATPG